MKVPEELTLFFWRQHYSNCKYVQLYEDKESVKLTLYLLGVREGQHKDVNITARDYEDLIGTQIPAILKLKRGLELGEARQTIQEHLGQRTLIEFDKVQAAWKLIKEELDK